MAAKKNEKVATKSNVTKKPEKKVTAQAISDQEASEKIALKKSTQARTTVAKSPKPARAKATTKKAVAKPKKESPLLIEFKLKAPDAKTVSLAGDFNGWLIDKDKMDKDENGIWKTKVKLSRGKHEYQFVVDGNWWTDPENPNRTWNSFGTQNSVKEI